MNRAMLEALAWALVHFIWQGAGIALAAGLVAAALGRARPVARYAVFAAGLAAMAATPALSLSLFLSSSPLPGAAGFGSRLAMVSSSAPPTPAAQHAPGPDWLAWLVCGWACGVALLSARALGGWVHARRLTRRRIAPVPASVRQAARRLAARLDVRRAFRVLASEPIDVPAVWGWLRPVILVPAAALTQLSPGQIELLLAHELAHIRRCDYLVNLLQSAVETALFYHPAVWWVSRQVRMEREHCCDDLAVQACGDPVAYAGALAALESLRGTSSPFVVAADGGSLLARIRRLARPGAPHRAAPPAWLGAFLPIAAVVAAALSAGDGSEPLVAAAADRPAHVEGFLGGLAQAGYTSVSVDEIIALKEHGVDPAYVRGMLSAGLGVPSVEQMIRLREHGVEPEYVAQAVRSGLIESLGFDSTIRLREHGVDVADAERIRRLGYGPYSVEEVITLREESIDSRAFKALKDSGLDPAGRLGLEHVVKLHRAGII